MTLEQLKEIDTLVKQQLVWDAKNVDKVLQRTTELKINILAIYSKHVDKLKSIGIDKDKLYGSRFKYYNENYDRRLSNRKDIEDMINQEPEFNEMAKQFVMLETVVSHLEKLLKIISETEWSIKNWIEVKKFYAMYGEPN